jgi:hypothetical protein
VQGSAPGQPKARLRVGGFGYRLPGERIGGGVQRRVPQGEEGAAAEQVACAPHAVAEEAVAQRAFAPAFLLRARAALAAASPQGTSPAAHARPAHHRAASHRTTRHGAAPRHAAHHGSARSPAAFRTGTAHHWCALPRLLSAEAGKSGRPAQALELLPETLPHGHHHVFPLRRLETPAQAAAHQEGLAGALLQLRLVGQRSSLH